MKKLSLILLFSGFLFSFSIGCSDSGSNSGGGDFYAVVSTVASDYSSSATSFLNNESTRIAFNDYNPLADSDHVVNTYGDYFFDIQRLNQDAITKFNKDDPTDPVWNYSTMDDVDEDTDGITSSNPYQIVHASSTKAYIIRYGSKRIWIVNPSAASGSSFKTGSINLSDFADSDGLPDAIGGVIINSKLYVLCQNYNQNTWIVAGDSRIVVIDTATDTAVDTDTATTSVDAIDLGLEDALVVKAYGSKIYAACVNAYSDDSGTGIAVVDTSDYSVTTIAGGTCVSNVAVLSDTKGYFVKYSGWGSNILYSFNPGTGEVGTTAIAGISGRNIADIQISPDGKLWVADATGDSGSGIYVVDPSTDTLEQGPISTNLMPQNIAFFE